MARKSTKHNTGIGTKFYVQDDTQRAELLGVESMSPGPDSQSWNSEEFFNVTTGLTQSKKTVIAETEYTFVVNELLDETNPGAVMLHAYAAEEGNKERLHIIVEKDDATKTQLAVDVIITGVQTGDVNNALQKTTFTAKGNPSEVPEEPGA